MMKKSGQYPTAPDRITAISIIHGTRPRGARDHAPWFSDPDRITTEIEEFLTGSHAAPLQSHRALRAVLFTDMVASTQRAAATGDERWRAVLHRFGQITAELTQRFGGMVVKSTGDGYLTTFDGPTQAIRCAETLRAGAETIRCGSRGHAACVHQGSARNRS
jgi:class 3 adenylate cyclase